MTEQYRYQHTAEPIESALAHSPDQGLLHEYFFGTNKRFERRRIQQIHQNVLGEPMNPDCSNVVMIPADWREPRLYHTLEHYQIQPEFAEGSAEIAVLVNAPIGSNTQESTAYQQGLKYKVDFPDMPVTLASLEYPAQARQIGRVRKDIANLALLRAAHAGVSLDRLILFTHDADLKEIDGQYLKIATSQFEAQESLGALTGFVEYPRKDYRADHLFFALQRFEQIYETIVRYKDGHIVMRGGNTAFRASDYVLLGGHGKARIGENKSLYKSLLGARGDHSARYDQHMQIVTDSRRQQMAFERGVPYASRYDQFGLDDDLSNEYYARPDNNYHLSSVHDPDFDERLVAELQAMYCKHLLTSIWSMQRRGILDQSIETSVEKLHDPCDFSCELYNAVVDSPAGNSMIVHKQHLMKRAGFFSGVQIDFDGGLMIVTDISVLKENISGMEFEARIKL